MALSKRAEKALEVLKAGGKFRYALESGYRGREQFHMRLIDESGHVVAGVGYAAKVELEEAGEIEYRHPYDARSSAWPQEWVLAERKLSDYVNLDAEMLAAERRMGC